MSRPNSHDRTFAALFTGADPQGDIERSYVALTLKLLAALDASPSLTGPDESVRVVESLVSPDSLAANRDPDRNFSAERVADLEAQLLVTSPDRHPAIYRRLAQAKVLAEKFDLELQGRRAKAAIADDPEVKTALAHGSAWIARFTVSHDPDQQVFLEQLQKAQERLRVTGDTSEYWAVSDKMEADRKQLLLERSNVLDERAAEARAAAEQARAEMEQPAAESEVQQ